MQKQVEQSANTIQLQNQEYSEPELKSANDKAEIKINSLRDLTKIALSDNNEALKLSILKEIADSAFHLDFTELAINAYEELIERNAHQPFDVYDNLSVAYARIDDHEGVTETLKKYVKLNPSETFGYYNLARAYQRAKNYGGVIYAYESLLENKVDTSLVHRGLGEAYLCVNDVESALREYEVLKQNYRNTTDFEELSNMIKEKWDSLLRLLSKISSAHRSVG